MGLEHGDRSVWLVVGPTVFALALLVLATAYTGAFDVRHWAPPALFVLLMLLTLVLRGGVRVADRWLALSLVGIWGLAAWAALSASWAASAGDALEGAGRLALYAAIVTVPLVAVHDLRALRVAGYGAVGGIAAIALYTLARMLVDGPSVFLAGRLDDPVGYRNATALLFCLAYWPLIVVAAARGRGRLVRAACLAAAELMLGLAFLTQSRGVLLGLGCGAVVTLALSPDRLRRVWLALLSVALLACAAPSLLAPYHTFAGGRGAVQTGDIALAAHALVALVAASALAGFLLAVFDTGLRPANPAISRVRGAARAGLIVLGMAAPVAGLAAVHGDPAGELQTKWREFTSLQTTSYSTTRYTSTGGQRYDLWRVAWDELRSHPLTGVGQGSYQFGYYRLRRTDRNLDDPHGLLFQLGSELGLVGLGLFALVVVGFAGSLRRWWGAASHEARRSAGGLLASGATFAGQALVDWMWRIPGLTALGLLCPAVAVALLAHSASSRRTASPLGCGAGDTAAAGGRESTLRATPALLGGPRATPALLAGRPGGPAPLARAAMGGVLLVAVALVLSLYLSDVYVRRARDELGHSPAAQLAAARTASTLDPWAVAPHYLEASALETLGERSAARAQLEDAHRLEPESLVPLGLLGDFEARGAKFAQARSYYKRALALDPLDVGLRQLAFTGGRP